MCVLGLPHQSPYTIRASHFLTSLNSLRKNKHFSQLEGPLGFLIVLVPCFCVGGVRLCKGQLGGFTVQSLSRLSSSSDNPGVTRSEEEPRSSDCM